MKVLLLAFFTVALFVDIAMVNSKKVMTTDIHNKQKNTFNTSFKDDFIKEEFTTATLLNFIQ